MAWSKAYEPCGEGSAIQQTIDGGFVIAGRTCGSPGDALLIKVDGNGSLQWHGVYGGDGPDRGNAVVEPLGCGYAIAGRTESLGNGSGDVYLIRAGDNGGLLWQHAYGGSGDDEGMALLQSADGGYIIAGVTASSGNSSDIYLVKTDARGTLQWEKTYGEPYDDMAASIERTREGGYIISGYYGVAESQHRAYLLKVDAWGRMEWDTKLSANDSIASHARQTSDRGYIVVGSATSNEGKGEVLLAKVDHAGNVEWQKTIQGNGRQKGLNVYRALGGGLIIIGAGSSDTKHEGLLIKTDDTGNIEWQQAYGQDASIRDGVPTRDGGMALVGSIDDGTTQHVGLIKVDVKDVGVSGGLQELSPDHL